MSKEKIDRLVYLAGIVQKVIKQNSHIQSETIYYDDAMCDVLCLCNDLEIAIDDIQCVEEKQEGAE